MENYKTQLFIDETNIGYIDFKIVLDQKIIIFNNDSNIYLNYNEINNIGGTLYIDNDEIKFISHYYVKKTTDDKSVPINQRKYVEQLYIKTY